VTDAPAALLSAIVTILALLVFFYMGIRVGTMRGRHNIVAPATSGHPEFDRAFRIHYNTLESLMLFCRFFGLRRSIFGLGAGCRPRSAFCS
jgi:glutathione S-transferase